MSGADLYALLGGILQIGWAGYQLVRLYRTGEIAALHYLPLSANRNDPALWRGFITAVDFVFLCLGLALVANPVMAFLR
ncbi:hypothetical protein [Sphingomonas montana]|uniref:hypothetical protein n=1 Tax=Sphingomonas montana TaxID=1843236 RepID=UPI00101AE99E|nr:hypothetical protein [Sphingomonas montana]